MAVATITIAANASFGGTTQNTDYISTTPPPVASNGQRWWNPDYAKMFTYYDEVASGIPGGDSAQWIEVK